MVQHSSNFMDIKEVKLSMFELLYYRSVVFTNDMKHIHTHAVGNKFDRIHAIANEYYEKASEESDTFVELALELDEKVQNPSNAADILNYSVANEDEYFWENAMEQITARMEAYIEGLCEVRTNLKLSVDMQSLLDDIIRYWKKERNYKLKLRLKE